MTKVGTCCMVSLFCAAVAIVSPAQIIFTSLASFALTNGAKPYSTLIRGVDGNFYGTTNIGGDYDEGTVFRISPGGTLTTLHSFNGGDGGWPLGALVQANDGNFYGTTGIGGHGGGGCDFLGCGTVFKMTPSGTLTTVYSFGGTDGAHPGAGLVQATDGNFYGTTAEGGAHNNCHDGCGTVFKVTPGGTLTSLHSFNYSDGAYPFAALLQASDGNFYGTTAGGFNCGDYGCGTVFKITPAGMLTIVHSFDDTDGAEPDAGLVQARDGNFYGTTIYGGYGGSNCPDQSPAGCGTVFRLTPGGVLTTLYSFCSQPNCVDGSFPYAGLVEARDGSFYGTTQQGGAYGAGAVFKITPEGALTTLHSFNGGDGGWPWGGLVQAIDGFFYGTTSLGGAYGDGTVFRLGVVRACSICRP